MHQQDFVAALEAAPRSDYARVHAEPGAQARDTKSNQSGPTKRSPLPSVGEIDAAIERKYGCRPPRR